MDEQERITQLEQENAQLKAEVARQQAVIQELTNALEVMSQRVKNLENRLSKDSHNSSFPPSSDRFSRVRRTRSLRERSGKQPGGQEGHQGQSLQLVQTPDCVQVHVLSHCPSCQQDLEQSPVVSVERRQVREVPVPRVVVTEHQAERKYCSTCQRLQVATFPEEVRATVQYGPGIQALAVYVNQYHLVPLSRTTELLGDLLGISVSTASLLSWVQQAAGTLKPVDEQIKAALKAEVVKHKDETGAFALGNNGKQHWFHVTCTSRFTHYHFHRSRGRAALLDDGIMPDDPGIYVHDCHSPYFTFEQAHHALCGVHLLRDLTYILERTGQPWAAQMIWLLKTYKAITEEARASGMDHLPEDGVRLMRACYIGILRQGQKAHPPSERGPKPKRGRAKRSEASLLVARLHKYRHEVLRFITDLRVPFDNNLAERDVRMIKLQQKISGTFRSQEGASAFACLRGYLSTLRKQGLDLLSGLRLTLSGHPLLPAF
jgi:transposase